MTPLWARSCRYVCICKSLTITVDSVYATSMGENNYRKLIASSKISEMCLSSWWYIRSEDITGVLLVTSMEETSKVTRIVYSKFSGDITKHVDFKLEGKK
jgi:hypothetical protein